ncbi:MAG: pyridoxamine 5'-phosphate oxidase family protein [Desulfobacterota bacterium]|nr:pyridoxamine 5'-phosphate oxidase family protein [Thermodesulfobacteriota bacterium]
MHHPTTVRGVIEDLFKTQCVGVLATQSEQYPYCNLVAFTPDADLTSLLFATPRATQKYRNLTLSRSVAFLVDNRSEVGADFAAGVAVTALGTICEAPPEQDTVLRQRHCSRHTALTDFILNPDCALLVMQVDIYIVVRGVAETAVFPMR